MKADQDEFALLQENADEAGLLWREPPSVRECSPAPAASESARCCGARSHRQRENGRWEWRYDRLRGLDDFSPLWDDVSAAAPPLRSI
jgi:hypothetical protein